MMVMMLNLLWTELVHFVIEILLEKTKSLCIVTVSYFKHIVHVRIGELFFVRFVLHFTYQ